jgi:hypothetical protein
LVPFLPGQQPVQGVDRRPLAIAVDGLRRSFNDVDASVIESAMLGERQVGRAVSAIW